MSDFANLCTLFFDVTANDGWNVTAWATWAFIGLWLVGTIIEWRAGR